MPPKPLPAAGRRSKRYFDFSSEFSKERDWNPPITAKTAFLIDIFNIAVTLNLFQGLYGLKDADPEDSGQNNDHVEKMPYMDRN